MEPDLEGPSDELMVYDEGKSGSSIRNSIVRHARVPCHTDYFPNVRQYG